MYSQAMWKGSTGAHTSQISTESTFLVRSGYLFFDELEQIFYYSDKDIRVVIASSLNNKTNIGYILEISEFQISNYLNN